MASVRRNRRGGPLGIALLTLGACSQAGTSAVDTANTLGETFITPVVQRGITDIAVGTWECRWFETPRTATDEPVELEDDILLVDVAGSGAFRYAMFDDGDSVEDVGEGTWTLEGKRAIIRLDDGQDGDADGLFVDGVALDSVALIAREARFDADGTVEEGDDVEAITPSIIGETRVELAFEDRTTWRCDKTTGTFTTVPPNTRPPSTRPPSTRPPSTRRPTTTRAIED